MLGALLFIIFVISWYLVQNGLFLVLFSTFVRFSLLLLSFVLQPYIALSVCVWCMHLCPLAHTHTYARARPRPEVEGQKTTLRVVSFHLYVFEFPLRVSCMFYGEYSQQSLFSPFGLP